MLDVEGPRSSRAVRVGWVDWEAGCEGNHMQERREKLERRPVVE